jgi:hypothetical protein
MFPVLGCPVLGCSLNNFGAKFLNILSSAFFTCVQISPSFYPSVAADLFHKETRPDCIRYQELWNIHAMVFKFFRKRPAGTFPPEKRVCKEKSKRKGKLKKCGKKLIKFEEEKFKENVGQKCCWPTKKREEIFCRRTKQGSKIF